MLRFTLRALDGEMGRVHDLYFDDASWTVRYLVADTGRWLPDRTVLISPEALGRPDFWSEPVALTRQQIRDSPGLEAHEPVSRQHEAQLAAHFGWPTYWPDDARGGRELSEPIADTLKVPKSPAAAGTGRAPAREKPSGETRELSVRDA